MSTREYHRHDDGQVVPGPAVRCIDPNAGAHNVVVLADEGLGHRLPDLLEEHWPKCRVNPWYLADLLRGETAPPPPPRSYCDRGPCSNLLGHEGECTR